MEEEAKAKAKADRRRAKLADNGGPSTSGSSGDDPPPTPPPAMAYSEEDKADPTDVNKLVDGIKVPYDVKDPVYWFRRLEIRMQTVGIGSQFWKRVALEQNLPPELCACIKEYLILEQSAAKTVYSDCKKTILEIYGPKPEANFATAQGIMMTGTPSEAGKRIRELICQKNPPLTDCCCAAAVGKLWRDVLPPPVRNQVANFDIKTQFKAAMDHADKVYHSAKMASGAGALVNQMAALSLDETLPALQQDVAAFKASKKSQQRGQAAQSRPSSTGQRRPKLDVNNRDTWGKPDKDWAGQTPPRSVCFQHYRFGKRAHFCRLNETCPWRDITAPRPQ